MSIPKFVPIFIQKFINISWGNIHIYEYPAIGPEYIKCFLSLYRTISLFQNVLTYNILQIHKENFHLLYFVFYLN